MNNDDRCCMQEWIYPLTYGLKPGDITEAVATVARIDGVDSSCMCAVLSSLSFLISLTFSSSYQLVFSFLVALTGISTCLMA